MKKILSVALAVILLSQTCAFASDLPFFDKDYLSYEETVTYSLTLNKGINVLLGSYDLFNDGHRFVDFYKMIEGLFGTTSNLSGKANISPDYKSGKIYAGGSSIIPLNINKNLSLTANANTDVWMEYDFSDRENPYFQMIQNTPMYDKYVIYNLSDIFSNLPGSEYKNAAIGTLGEIMSDVLGKENAERYKKAYSDLFVKYGKITKSGKNYTVRFDDEAFKHLIAEAVLSLSNYTENLIISNNYATSEEFVKIQEQISTAVNSVISFLNDTSIVGEEGIVIKIQCDGRGYMTVSDVSANICVNIFEILAKNDDSYRELAENGIINYRDGIIDFTVNAKTEITKIANVKVDFPVMTEENSFNASDISNYLPEYDYPSDFDECYHYEWANVLHEGLPVIIDGKFYPHLRDTALAIGFSDCDILYDNGKITLTRPDWVNCGNYTTAAFEVGGNIVYLDQTPYKISEPALETGNSVLISDEIAKIIFRTDENFNSDVTINFAVPCYDIWFNYKICNCDI